MSTFTSTTRTQVAIVGGGPAGLMLSHLLHRAGIESIVLDTRTYEQIETTHRAGILERDSVRLLVESGVSDRVLTDGHEHQASTCASTVSATASTSRNSSAPHAGSTHRPTCSSISTPHGFVTAATSATASPTPRSPTTATPLVWPTPMPMGATRSGPTSSSRRWLAQHLPRPRRQPAATVPRVSVRLVRHPRRGSA